MNITTISVTYTRKVNLGDYESAEASVGYFAKLDNDDPDELEDEVAMEVLIQKARNNVKAALEPVCKSSQYWLDKATVTKRFMNRVVETTEEDEF
jgi:hypothetical protein